MKTDLFSPVATAEFSKFAGMLTAFRCSLKNMEQWTKKKKKKPETILTSRKENYRRKEINQYPIWLSYEEHYI